MEVARKEQTKKKIKKREKEKKTKKKKKKGGKTMGGEMEIEEEKRKNVLTEWQWIVEQIFKKWG